MIKYPMLEINLSKIRNNIEQVAGLCENNGIEIAGVIKGFNALEPIVEEYVQSSCKQIASSRIQQLKECKERGITKPLMLIRIPMLSEIEEVVKYTDISLNSERVVLDAINEESIRQNKIHKVVIMADLGDLREGYFSPEELIETAIYVENELDNVYLSGIGVNLGCYGSIKPTSVNLGKLCDIATEIEEKIGRNLDIISGGATSSLTLLKNGLMPEKINHLRIGESILLNRDLPDFWGCDFENMYTDTFKLKAEVIEVKEKPSYPVGEIFIDAFGNKPEYTDIGNITRALFAVGKQDIGDFDKIIPDNKGVNLIGASSDHLIADVTSIKDNIKVGEIFEFELSYQAMLFLTGTPWITKKYVKN